jgi:hypothetical protein
MSAGDAGRLGAVGLWLGPRGAVIALIRPDPLRLAAIASVSWPAAGSGPDRPPVPPDARRGLARARRRLGLPRWCPVAVVVEPVADPAGAEVGSRGTGIGPGNAELLARSGLAAGWSIPPDRADQLWSTMHLAVDPPLAAALADRPARLATGAALATVFPAEPPRFPAGPAPSRPGGAPAPEGPPEPTEPAVFASRGIDVRESAGESGWAVQRIRDGEPAGSGAWAGAGEPVRPSATKPL